MQSRLTKRSIRELLEKSNQDSLTLYTYLKFMGQEKRRDEYLDIFKWGPVRYHEAKNALIELGYIMKEGRKVRILK